VHTATGLISGLVERSPLSFPLIFLVLGVVLGGGVLGVINMGPHDEVLEVIATLTLALVLFLDAVKLDVRELGKRWAIPFLILGPGTMLIIGLGALPFVLLLGVGWTLALIAGAILASTDPVVLREIVRDQRIPRSVRQVLRIEAGTNDIVVLPVLLVLIAVKQGDATSVGAWAEFLGKLLILGPAVGFAVGGVGAWAMSRVDRKFGVRAEYQALYGVGLAFAAFTAATAAGGDGFLGAFAAGFAVVVLNQALCNCFLEYGEITSEMAMLVTFILFGAVLSGMFGLVDWVPTLLISFIVVFALRPPILSMVLVKARMSWAARGFVAWFGPRGLNSLLLALPSSSRGSPGPRSSSQPLASSCSCRCASTARPRYPSPRGTAARLPVRRLWRSERTPPPRSSVSTWTNPTASRPLSSRRCSSRTTNRSCWTCAPDRATSRMACAYPATCACGPTRSYSGPPASRSSG
jgi:NhaP-type Na+/H+ or K+/H+ antiporter